MTTNMERLVAKQVLLCELKRSLEAEGQRPPPVRVEEIAYGPCLLLSRECGSGGDEVARMVAEQLGWHVFDRDIVEEIAQRAHVRQQLVESVDEHVRARWREQLHRTHKGESIARDTYLYYLREVLLALGHHGDVVIVGRGARYLLPPECAVGVRVIAPLKWRASHWTETQGGSFTEALDRVQQCDDDRTEFIRKAFGHEAGLPLDYDLVLNTGRLSIEKAAQVVLETLRIKLGVRVGKSSCAS
jgi:cytidylate kinase